jgi:hypothetical protein
MITKHTILGDIGVYVITVDGHATAMLYGATKKNIQYLYEHSIFASVTRLAPTYCTKKKKVLYPKGHVVQVQDYDHIVELLQNKAAQG